MDGGDICKPLASGRRRSHRFGKHSRTDPSRVAADRQRSYRPLEHAGLDAATVQKLTQVQFVINDLPDGILGEEAGNLISLDRNAAGNGWFVDSTRAADEEFALSGSSPQLKAVDPRALDRIDLLSVVEHELGHVAGLTDLDALADDVMNGVLGVGVRRNASHADAVLASA